MRLLYAVWSSPNCSFYPSFTLPHSSSDPPADNKCLKYWKLKHSLPTISTNRRGQAIVAPAVTPAAVRAVAAPVVVVARGIMPSFIRWTAAAHGVVSGQEQGGLEHLICAANCLPLNVIDTRLVSEYFRSGARKFAVKTTWQAIHRKIYPNIEAKFRLLGGAGCIWCFKHQ